MAGRRNEPSRFVVRAVERFLGSAPLDVLDLPAGTGRHSLWLAAQGHRVTAADIDETLVDHTVMAARRSGWRCGGCVVDASRDLPFADNSFDLVLIIDFIDEHLLEHVGRLLRPGGLLIHESYAARGGNWLQLLPPGRTTALLGPKMALAELRSSLAGQGHLEAEALKIVARRVF